MPAFDPALQPEKNQPSNPLCMAGAGKPNKQAHPPTRMVDDEAVFERGVGLATARVALSRAPSKQLPVDTARLVVFGGDHVQAATCERRVGERVEALRAGVKMNTMRHFMNIDDLAVLRVSPPMALGTPFHEG